MRLYLTTRWQSFGIETAEGKLLPDEGCGVVEYPHPSFSRITERGRLGVKVFETYEAARDELIRCAEFRLSVLERQTLMCRRARASV